MSPSVLVTGASRGIGLAITERMSQRGWDVYATARSADALHRLERIPNVHAIPLDITDRRAIAGFADRLPTALNGVVNNAGVIVNGPVEGLSLDDLSRQLDVNVTAQIGVTQEQCLRPVDRCRVGRTFPVDRLGLSSRPALKRRPGRYARAQGSAGGFDRTGLGGRVIGVVDR